MHQNPGGRCNRAGRSHRGIECSLIRFVDLAADTAKETQSASARVKASADQPGEKEKRNERSADGNGAHYRNLQRIGNIITNIEDIASRTNLLSLNASLKLPEQEKQEKALR